MRYLATGVMVDAQPLAELQEETRKALGVGDDRKHHIGIFHTTTGELLNTMEPEQFRLHYAPLNLSDTPAIQAGTPLAAAPEGAHASTQMTNREGLPGHLSDPNV